ncbi:hypothetical protein GQ53DRAFT_874958 [Thozetella sp. PMI_491]|nr:hypothetical protein GQ53DRAFT_874958 [Thozetella sp. PMI_491]
MAAPRPLTAAPAPIISRPLLTNLRPSPSSDSLSQKSGVEAIEGCEMDVNMPEMLAWNLESSKAIFHSLDLTAGAPDTALAADRRKLSIGMASTYGSYPDQNNGLSSIAEQESIVETDSETSAHDLVMDNVSSSDESEESSDPIDFIRDRKQSVTTAATSVTGPSNSPRFSKASPTSQSIQGSWYSDDNDDYEPASRARTPDIESRRWPRAHPSTLCLEVPIRRAITPGPYPASRAERNSSPQRSLSRAATIMERPRLVHIPASPSGNVMIPARTSSSRIQIPHSQSNPVGAGWDSEVAESDLDVFLPFVPGSSNRPPICTSPSIRTVIDATQTAMLSTPEQRLRRTGGLASPRGASLERGYTIRDRAQFSDDGSESDPYASQTRALASMAANSHRWLDQAVDAFALQHAVPSNIPIAPEIVDNLRIHVENFPDTMLTCKSLAFETIRAYSKKLKHLNTPMLGTGHVDFTLDDHAEPAKGTIHRAVRFISRRVTSFSKPRPSRPSTSAGAGSSALLADWTPIKNIFPLGSDYMCESLYAHLVAYNYVRSLYPTAFPTDGQPHTVPVAEDRPPATPVEKDDGTRISRKAATILGISNTTGLAQPPAPTGPRHHPSRAKLSGRPVATQETMDELRLGLVKCIGCLVTSVSMIGAPANKTPQFTQELLRSLAETVRCSEERAV